MQQDPLWTLPQPNQPFEWVQGPASARTLQGGGSGSARTALICRPLAAVADHLFTTRGWTLGTARANGDEAWAEVAAALGVESGSLLRLRQVHGAAVVAASMPGGARPEADILISDRAELAVAVQTADCVPLLIADRRTGAVSAAHAGWRGLAAGVPGVAVAALARQYGSRPADLLAAIGPSIRSCCYEVGAEVGAAFASAFPAGGSARWFAAGRRPHRQMFDTGQSAYDQLLAAGVPAGQIFDARLCTACHAEAFCSYRRDGAPAGRMAAGIRSRPPHP